MNQSRACKNQAQIEQNLRPSPNPGRNIAENHLRRRFPGTNIEHIDRALLVEQQIQ